MLAVSFLYHLLLAGLALLTVRAQPKTRLSLTASLP